MKFKIVHKGKGTLYTNLTQMCATLLYCKTISILISRSISAKTNTIGRTLDHRRTALRSNFTVVIFPNK